MRFNRREEWSAARRTGSRWRQWLPFTLLLLVGASRWLLVAARPETESTPASAALGCAWAALFLLTLSLRPGRFPIVPRDPAQPAARRSLLAGAMLFAGPVMPLLIGGRTLDGGSVTMALALTPVVVAVATAATGTESAGAAGRAWPGLAAVAGLLLILIQPDLADVRSDAALLLAPLLTGTGAALFCAYDLHSGRIHDSGSATSPAESRGTWLSGGSSIAATAALASGALVLAIGVAVGWWITGGRPSIELSAVACDGLLALLGLSALQRLGPTRWSAQFALLPLLVLVEGLVLVRPAITARAVAGLALLVLASVSLLLPPEPEGEERPAVVPR